MDTHAFRPGVGVEEEDANVEGLNDQADAIDGDDEEAVGMHRGHAV